MLRYKNGEKKERKKKKGMVVKVIMDIEKRENQQ